MATTIISYPLNQINESIAEGTSLDSSELVKLVWVNLSEATTDTYVEIVYNLQTITLYIQDECRYTPMDIVFSNKSGEQQILTFFKNNVESLSVTSEEFESDRGQPSEGNHQFKKYNKQGRTKFKVNSGFVEESVNEAFRQLVLSEDVWHYDGVDFIPINVSSTSLEYKTTKNDRLINYEIEFEYAYNEINNI
jgi:hypothetical protein